MRRTDSQHLTCCTPTGVHRALAAGVELGRGGAQAAAEPRPVRRTADMLVLGRLVTGVPGTAAAEGMAISGGKITAIGSASDLDGLTGPGTEVIKVSDGVIAPGFIEPHMHIWTSALVYPWADCSPLANPDFDGVVATMGKASQATPDGGWVTGKLFDPSLYPGEPDLTRDILDRIAPDKPAFVLNASMHFGYANTKALELAGIEPHAIDPPGGSFGRNADGTLNGVLGEEGALSLILKAFPRPDQQAVAATVMAILNDAAAAGVTSLREAATGAVLGTAEVALLHQLNAATPLPTRVSTAQWALCGAQAWAEAGVTPFSGDDMVRADAWKIVTDGSNQGRSGYFEQPYLGEASSGHPNFTPEQLHQLMAEGLDGGWQLMVHANGDAAVEFALGAFEHALPGRPATDLRHRMEHVSFSYRRQLERMAAIGVSPSFLMNHVYYWGRVFRDVILGPDRANRLDRVASALQAGLRPSLHSDYNVTPMDPLLAAKTAATRVMRDGGEVLNEGECVSAHAALKAITIDAAWQIHADDRGTLAAGNAADWTVLSQNPWETAPEGWPDIEVLETRVGGRVTHQA